LKKCPPSIVQYALLFYYLILIYNYLVLPKKLSGKVIEQYMSTLNGPSFDYKQSIVLIGIFFIYKLFLHASHRLKLNVTFLTYITLEIKHAILILILWPFFTVYCKIESFL